MLITFNILLCRYTHSVLEDNAPRAYHACIALGQFIYVLGGFDGSQYFNGVKRFSPVEKKWMEVAPMYYQVRKC